MKNIFKGIGFFLVLLCWESALEDIALVTMSRNTTGIVTYCRKKFGGLHSSGYSLLYEFQTMDGSLISGVVSSSREHGSVKIRYLPRFPKVHSPYSTTSLILLGIFWFGLGVTGIYLVLRNVRVPLNSPSHVIIPVLTTMICSALYIFYFSPIDWFSLKPHPKIAQGAIGNTSGNLLNQGELVQDSGWIYFSNPSPSESGIFKTNLQGNSKSRLSSNVAFSMNIKDNWIYYINFNDNSYIYKISSDGSKRQCILKEKAHELVMMGDWLFLVNANDNDKLYRCNLKGNQLTKLNDDPSSRLNPHGEWIYYLTGHGDYPVTGPVYRVKNNGTDRQIFLQEDITRMLSDSSYLYYIRSDPEKYLYRISLDQPDSSRQLSDSSMAFFNLRSQHLYFTSFNSGYIYRLDLATLQITPIQAKNCWNLYLAGDWLFYRLDMMISDDSRLHKTRIP